MQGANIHANDDEALKNAASRKRNGVWQLLSAFIQEEKLLVAASESMLHKISLDESNSQTVSLPTTKSLRSKI